MDDRYGTDVLANGLARPVPARAAAGAGRPRPRRRVRRGRLLRSRHGGPVGHRRARGPPRAHAASSRSAPGFLIDGEDVVLVPPTAVARRRLPRGRHPARSPSPTRARASRARAASSSRVATTPNSSRRCGATTCGSRASWWSTCRASTCSRRRSRRSPRAPSAAMACWSTTSSPGSKESRITDAILRGPPRRAPAGSSVIPTSTCGSASRRARSASRRGPKCRAASSSRSACAAPSAGPRGIRPTSPGRGSGSSASVKTYRDLEPSFLGRVEELIDYVTA